MLLAYSTIPMKKFSITKSAFSNLSKLINKVISYLQRFENDLSTKPLKVKLPAYLSNRKLLITFIKQSSKISKMRFSLKALGIGFLFGSFLIGCQLSQKKPSDQSDVSFIQNPQDVPEQEVKTLTIGSPAPDFNLPGVDGQYYNLSSFADAKALAIVFTCNHCPTAQAYEDRIIEITNDYKDKGVQLVAISPNSPLGLMYEELGYSDLNDDYSEMIIRSKNKSYNFPYLYDGDTHSASLLYGPVATPHVFVFDNMRTLQYVGRIDANEKPGTGNGEDLRNALDAIIADKIPEISQTKTFGCSTKWAWKKHLKENVDKEWDSREVSLTEVDLENVKTLMKNTSDKLRLVNVWASWCGPCVLEYPEFVNIQRMFGARDFEFVSISTDKLSRKEKALEIIQKNHSALNNYICSNDDKYAFIEAIDPNWNGALPYTALIEPGGNIVYAHQGEVDFYELKKAIVDHPMIGRVY